ncbi:hypothetical protein A11A3_03479 [Alcanivorax hongdengensis A-11-3]|uniref:Uncharacterized protein n=1 Tax=Alcanivorax hongdengensis A-11-3 TaxID=1177179 RepID=L0WEF6_9GAMM|nr:hypothetical protein [Alcanivorax hongdengensis]EKF75386.1 hypothetical protein A11A3_03479 [Alcanivorax hongdengensis A-11-3]MDX1804002.1 hypothetical protein [Alcanivorax sp.]
MIFEVNYLYRDASNYKQCESVVVDVADARSVEEVEAMILERFADLQVWPDVVHFRPEDLGWPTAYFEDHDEHGDDLGLHELEAIAETVKPVTAALP